MMPTKVIDVIVRSIALLAVYLLCPAASQRPIIRGYTMLIGNCADMFLNEKPVHIDVQSCANQCLEYTGCRGFSFDYQAQHCWLKWGLCDRIKPARLTPVVFYKNELWGFTAEAGSCPGQLAVPPVFTDVIACASQCRTMANCSGFTYDFEGDVCYLKAQACPTTLPSDVLAVESWVKYFRKDFWVPAALERTRKYLDDDDPAATSELFLNSLEQNTTNPLEMVFFDNNNGAPLPASLNQQQQAQHFPILTENDPWEAYANPSDGSDYVAISDDAVKILVHRATIANASEATCSRACSLDAHCSYFYLMRTEVTMVTVRNNKVEKDSNKTSTGDEAGKKKASSKKKQAAAVEETTTTSTTIVQTNCVLFAKWNASSGVSSSKRRQPDEGKLFQKTVHLPRNNGQVHSHIQHQPFMPMMFREQQQPQQLEQDQQQQVEDSSAHRVTLLSLRKRKRHLDEKEMQEVASEQMLNFETMAAAQVGAASVPTTSAFLMLTTMLLLLV